MKLKSTRNGPAVALLVLALCAGGFLATVWNYSRTHPFAESAEVVSRDGATRIAAVFPSSRKIQPGQRVVVAIPEDTNPARGGSIVEISEQGEALILLDSGIPAPVGTRVTVSIDGTVGPQPLP
jgi:hypothetical protein